MSAALHHGGRLDEAVALYGGDRSTWLDLSTGINPVPYPVGTPPADVWHRLPDHAAQDALIEAARAYYCVPEHMGIVAANGTQTLIELLPGLLNSQNVDIISPTYREHELCWRKAGRHVERVADTTHLSALSNCAVVVNPNNPDGRVFAPSKLITLGEEMSRRHGYLVIDEAFCDTQTGSSMIPAMRDNMLIYRSFGKFFGLAGLRLGFLIGPTVIIQQMQNLLGPWNVSGPALEIGRRALEDHTWQASTRERLGKDSSNLAEMLELAGLRIKGKNPLFVFAEHARASHVHETLLKAHILVRRFPEMPDKLRFGLPTDESGFSRLKSALEDIRAGL